jgi:hypothetical protein
MDGDKQPELRSVSYNHSEVPKLSSGIVDYERVAIDITYGRGEFDSNAPTNFGSVSQVQSASAILDEMGVFVDGMRSGETRWLALMSHSMRRLALVVVMVR